MRTFVYLGNKQNYHPSFATGTLHYIILVAVWGLLLISAKTRPHTTYLFLLMPIVVQLLTTLAWYDKLPAWLQPEDMNLETHTVLINLIVFILLNYNTFLVTLVIVPPVYAIPYYFQIVKQAESVHSSEDGLKY